MTEEQRKMLTEDVLGECWHERGLNPHGNPRYVDICSKCKQDITEMFGDYHRTFTTANDMMDLKNSLASNEFKDFLYFAKCQFSVEKHGYKSSLVHTDNFIDWLLNAERFCQLVADWRWVGKIRDNE